MKRPYVVGCVGIVLRFQAECSVFEVASAVFAEYGLSRRAGSFVVALLTVWINLKVHRRFSIFDIAILSPALTSLAGSGM